VVVCWFTPLVIVVVVPVATPSTAFQPTLYKKYPIASTVKPMAIYVEMVFFKAIPPEVKAPMDPRGYRD